MTRWLFKDSSLIFDCLYSFGYWIIRSFLLVFFVYIFFFSSLSFFLWLGYSFWIPFFVLKIFSLFWCFLGGVIGVYTLKVCFFDALNLFSKRCIKKGFSFFFKQESWSSFFKFLGLYFSFSTLSDGLQLGVEAFLGGNLVTFFSSSSLVSQSRGLCFLFFTIDIVVSCLAFYVFLQKFKEKAPPKKYPLSFLKTKKKPPLTPP